MKADAADRILKIVDDLQSVRIMDLRDGADVARSLDELRVAIEEVRSFADRLATAIAGMSRPSRSRSARRGPGAKTTAAKAPRKRGSSSRGPGRPRGGQDGFSPTSFVLESVRAAGKKGIRPRDIIERVRQAVPGRETNPSTIVSPLLNRLKRRGEVVNRDGRWFSL